ncbi:uncharacterized protein SRS1_16091 [Sporisorium reilianum f. sp. reilianum]|uniref:Selenoprotein W-related protein n=1 Tax=Sporisorium reilianum f. sp. reilianum TaxID=72559 RepID=A0A2N8UKF1_9BASI|nr:uncharacterized protein SRS1_16091 [Sporisorium reilianum f. sp. reilianum]
MSDSTLAPNTTADGVACIDCQPDAAHPSPAVAATSAAGATEDLMDPTTFVRPLGSVAGLPMPLVVIEYCHRCKFGLRANWIQQELLSTFAPSPPNADSAADTASVASVMLIPKVDDVSAGRFRVYIAADASGLALVWDRKVQGGFPEMRVLKQKVRDVVNPRFGLGHSDKK